MLSIIIPTYNRQTYLLEMVSTIENLNIPHEIIIINDSTEVNLNVCDFGQKQVTIINNTRNLGAAKSRKKGFLASKYKYVVFADDDDFYTDISLFEEALSLMENNKSIGLYSFQCNNYLNGNELPNRFNVAGLIAGAKYLQSFQLGTNKAQSTFTTVFCKEALRECGFFDDSILYMEVLRFKDAFLDNRLIGNYRQHGNNMVNKMRIGFLKDLLFAKYEIYLKSSALKKRWLIDQTKMTSYFFLKYNNYSRLQRYDLYLTILRIVPSVDGIKIIKNLIFYR